MKVAARARHSLALRALDARDRVAGRRDPLVPPRRLDFVGDSDFRATGDEMLGHLVELAGLSPDQRVLDVGCGIGRVARPLARHLSAAGSYEGFDIVATGIAWCRRRYAAEHPSFRFTLVDVANAEYHPGGTVAARDLRFPYETAEFDLAFATSVFTHLLEADADHYLAEMARVTRRGGSLLATFFLLDDRARALLRTGRATFDFSGDHGSHATTPAGTPEAAVAYDEGWLRARLAHHGLELSGPIRHGRWSGREDGLSFQDLVVARRT